MTTLEDESHAMSLRRTDKVVSLESFSTIALLFEPSALSPLPPVELSSRAKRGISSFIGLPQPSARSCQVGFSDLINASRFARVQALICFSRAIAPFTYLNAS